MGIGGDEWIDARGRLGVVALLLCCCAVLCALDRRGNYRQQATRSDSTVLSLSACIDGDYKKATPVC